MRSTPDNYDEEAANGDLVPESAPVIELRDGIPVFIHRSGAIPVTSELVYNLADDESTAHPRR